MAELWPLLFQHMRESVHGWSQGSVRRQGLGDCALARIRGRRYTVLSVLASLSPGSIFARDFQVIELIATGGMGAVYRVEQLSTRKHRALKIVTGALHDERARERFIREATVGANIDSDHVVQVISAGVDEVTALPWLAMELLHGCDLKRVVGYRQNLGPAQTLGVLEQVCHGLGAAHAAGIVHRDLKPQNIFVARSRRATAPWLVKILDFGIAKMTHESTTATGTATVGSPMWMAPEQINGETLSPATDVWALGLLAFWMLTGKFYWQAAHTGRPTVQALFAEQLFGDLVSASNRAVDFGCPTRIPEGFDAWFVECLVRDPSQRFVGATAAFNALRSVLAPLVASDARAHEPLLLDNEQDNSRAQTRKSMAPGVIDPDAPYEGTTGNFVTAEATGLDGSTQRSVASPAPGSGLVARHPPGSADATSAHASAIEYTAPQLAGEAAPRPTKSRGRLLSLMTGLAIAFGIVAVGLGVALVMEHDDAQDSPTVKLSVESPSSPGEDSADRDFDALTELGPGVPAVSVEFLGWSRDGHRFVVRTEHRIAKARTVGLIEVRDSVTVELVDLFAASDGELALERVKPFARWSAIEGGLGLRRDEPRRVVSDALEVAMQLRAPPLDTRVRQLLNRGGMQFHWWGVSPLGSGIEPSPPGPIVQLEVVQQGKRYALPGFAVPYTYDEVAMLAVDQGPRVQGTLKFHWAPSGDRFVMVAQTRVEVETTPTADARWYLRAAGPQIRLVDRGAGPAATRRLAQRLAAAGFPVVGVERASALDASRIIAQPSRVELGERVASALGWEMPVESTKGPLPVLVTVFVGRDQAL